MKKLALTLFSMILGAWTMNAQDCELTFNSYPSNCDYMMTFAVDGIPWNPEIGDEWYQIIEWDLGNGETQFSAPYAINITYDEPGTYIVHGTVQFGECEGTVVEGVVEVEDCGCPTGFDYYLVDNSQCSKYSFYLEGYYFGGFDIEANWNFGDGTSFEDWNGEVWHTYEEEGEYVVSVTYTSPYCEEEVSFEQTINVDFCEEDCIYLDIFDVQPTEGCFADIWLDGNTNQDWYVNDEYTGSGYNTTTELDDGWNLVCVSWPPQPACPLGDEACVEVEFECEEECDLWMEIGEYDCDSFGLFAETSTEAPVFWYINDEYYNTGYNLDWEPSEDGTYNICAGIETENCPEGYWVCEEVVVDCGEECELSIEIIENECGDYTMVADHNSESEYIHWYINGSLFPLISDSLPTVILWDDVFNVCATYSDLQCMDGIEVCEEIVVSCDGDCPTEEDVYAGQMGEDCHSWVFEIGSFVEGVEVYWNFGDGTDEEGGHFADHYYDEGGEYTVYAFYTTPECPDGVEFFMDIYVECPDCTLDIEVIDEGCGTFIFEAYNYPENANIYWEIDEVIVAENTHIIDWIFEDDLVHVVQAGYETPECPEGVWQTVDVQGEDCNPCPSESQYLIHEDCLTVTFFWDFEPEDGVFAETTYSFGDGNFDVTYEMSSTHTYSEPGSYEINTTFTSEACESGSVHSYLLVLEDCEEECTLDMEVIDEGCGAFVFEAYNYPENANIYWEIDGVIVEEDTHIIDWIFEDDDVHVVQAGYETPECPEGVWNVVSVESEDCNDCPTIEDFWAGTFEGSCLHWQFEIGSFAEGEEVVWNYGDGTEEIGGHYTDHEYEEDGVYVITAYFTSNDCPDGVYLTYTIEIDCVEDCDLWMGIEEYDCDSFTLFAETSTEAPVFWYINDEYFDTGYALDWEPTEEGVYEICAGIETPECPEGFWVCDEVVVSCNDCPTIYDFYAGQMGDDCLAWEFEIGSFAEGEEVLWDFGDGTTIFDGHYTDHEYNEAGVYVVTAYYTSFDCPDGVWLTYSIEVESCSDCVLEVDYFYETCEVIYFDSYTLEDSDDVAWYYDGEYQVSGDDATIGFPTEGWHTVCAVYETPECPDGVEWCHDFYIDYDDCDCTEVGFAFDSDMEEGGPEIIGWTLYNQTTEEVEGTGFCYYDYETLYCDAWACLPDGCYLVTLWGIGNDFDGDWDGIFSAPFIGEEMLETYNHSTDDCECYVSYEFSLNSDCEEEVDCYLEISADQIDEDSFIFEADVPEGATVTWDFGDGNTETGNLVDYTYSEPGCYVVCAFYETDDCPDGLEACVTVIVEEEDCTELTISISAELTEFDLELISWALESEGFEIGGDIPLTSVSGNIDLTFCVPDGCYTLDIGAVDGLLDLINLEIDVYLGDEWIAGLDDLTGEEGGSMVFGVNEDCTDSVGELMTSNISMYPNPSNGTITIDGSSEIIRQITVYDLTGRLVLDQMINSNITTIDLSLEADGFYQILIHTDENTYTEKLLLTK